MLKPFAAKLIKHTGQTVLINPKSGPYFDLDELQAYVGGYIEIIPCPNTQTGAMLIVNEEGKLVGLPVNPIATAIWHQYADPGSERMGDPIVGDVVLCHTSQLER